MVLMNLFAGEEWRRRYTEWTCRGRKNGTNGESSIDIYPLLCVRQTAG